MSNAIPFETRCAARFVAAAVLFAVIPSAASAAVQFNFTFPTVWSPPPITVQAPIVIRSPIVVGPVDPKPIIGTVPTTPTPIVPGPITIKFPPLMVLPIGPAPNPSPLKTVSTTPVQAPFTPPTSTAADVAAVVAGDNQFASDLYGTLSSTNTGNMVFSPYSISTALAMTYAFQAKAAVWPAWRNRSMCKR